MTSTTGSFKLENRIKRCDEHRVPFAAVFVLEAVRVLARSLHAQGGRSICACGCLCMHMCVCARAQACIRGRSTSQPRGGGNAARGPRQWNGRNRLSLGGGRRRRKRTAWQPVARESRATEQRSLGKWLDDDHDDDDDDCWWRRCWPSPTSAEK